MSAINSYASDNLIPHTASNEFPIITTITKPSEKSSFQTFRFIEIVKIDENYLLFDYLGKETLNICIKNMNIVIFTKLIDDLKGKTLPFKPAFTLKVT